MVPEGSVTGSPRKEAGKAAVRSRVLQRLWPPGTEEFGTKQTLRGRGQQGAFSGIAS